MKHIFALLSSVGFCFCLIAFPVCAIPPGAYQVEKITVEMVAVAPAIAEVPSPIQEVFTFVDFSFAQVSPDQVVLSRWGAKVKHACDPALPRYQSQVPEKQPTLKPIASPVAKPHSKFADRYRWRNYLQNPAPVKYYTAAAPPSRN